MKVGILAGGLGTRIQEETVTRPKPMVEIGGRPLLWHIMKLYAAYGFKEFVIALGYRPEVVKEYFLNYRYQASSLSIQLKTGGFLMHEDVCDDWTVHLLDTGVDTATGGRIKRIAEFNTNGTFMATYGDGVANVNIAKTLEFHRSHGKIATITGVRPPARFGALNLEDDRVVGFEEKPQVGEGWINGGFFVFEPKIAEYIEDDETPLETEALKRLARDGQLMCYRHYDFWQCMDTLRDRRYLESLWESKKAPWKVW